MTAVLRLLRDSDGGDELPPLDAWEIQMRGAGRSPRYLYNALHTLRQLERHSGKPVEEMAPIDVSRFLGRPELKANSRVSYFSSIACFYKWCGDNGGVDVTARLPRPKAAKGTPRPISDEQLRDLLAVRMHARTRVMILLAAFAGLRVHEIAKVRGEDVDPIARTLRVTGKGNLTVTLPLHPLLVDAAQHMPRKGWWFPANSRRRGQPVHWKSVTSIVSQAMDRAGIPAGTAHRLRHWYGTRLVGDGADLRTAQTLLRHANLNTTAIYVEVSDPKRVEAIDRLKLPARQSAPPVRTAVRSPRSRRSTVATISSYQTAAGKRYRVRYRTPDSRHAKRRCFRTRRQAEMFAASVDVSKLPGDSRPSRP